MSNENGTAGVLSPEELRTTNAYWRACNYLSTVMLYLRANPLLREPLKAENINALAAAQLLERIGDHIISALGTE
jgi:phosphoketolase